VLTLTFLGHQGWLVATPGTRVLLDPLLTEGFGHGALLGRVFPPRVLELDALGPIDAVILSHEHDDHFDIPSLDRLDRAIPIYLSSRSSSAARAILAELGFARVLALEPDAELSIDELRVRSFVTDHVGASQADEWDAFPLLIHDVDGHGSVLTSVDVRPRVADLERARAIAAPGVWIYANNFSHAGFQDALARAAPSSDLAPLQAAVCRRHDELRATWGAPRAVAICGNGWSFPGSRAWIDHNLFPVASEALADALRERAGHVDVVAPGHTLIQRDGELAAVEPAIPGVRAAPRARWPDRSYRGDVVTLGDYRPASEVTRLGAEGRARLLAELTELARFFYGRRIFAQLCSVPARIDGRRAQLCLSLRDDDGPLILVHDLQSCSFVPADDAGDPIAAHASGLECWAADLLALLTGDIGASALCYAGRLRTWNHAPRRLYLSPAELWTFAHPLRRPDAALRLYRRLAASLPAGGPRVAARAPGSGSSRG
jgi:L-ascorbate metabolism protein UlaG (beta-lactamase superfamily)